MTAQNEHLLQKIVQLEKDNISLLKALQHTETHRTVAEKRTVALERFIELQGLSDAKEVYLRQSEYEHAVEGFMEYMGATQEGIDARKDNRSLQSHQQRQEAYNAFKEDK